MEISDTEDHISISQQARRKVEGSGDVSYYSTPGCEGLLQQLLHLLRFGEGLPIVQAGRSSGKTAMANALYARLDDGSWLAKVCCERDQDIAELLERIVLGFGLHAGSGAGESLAALRHFSTQLANNKELAVLILDDAHLLDSQGLGAVVSLLQGNNLPGYGLHMAFFCAPGLVERIDEIGLLDAPVYDFEIPLFSPSELSGFLKSRFPASTSSKLSASLVQNIWHTHPQAEQIHPARCHPPHQKSGMYFHSQAASHRSSRVGIGWFPEWSQNRVGSPGLVRRRHWKQLRGHGY
jgi:hypothetical protein